MQSVMNAYFSIPVVLGFAVVIQGLLNRWIGVQFGLATAVLINAAVFFVLSLCFYAMAHYTPNLVPEFLQVKSSSEPFKISFLIPGICGFLLVLGLPWALQNIGTAGTFLTLIATQIFVSFLMDLFYFEMPFSIVKAIGAGLIFVGGLLTILAR